MELAVAGRQHTTVVRGPSEELFVVVALTEQIDGT